MSKLTHRPRRLRRGAAIRAMVQEHHLRVEDFVAPLFVKDGSAIREAIESMPGQFRFSVDELQKECRELQDLGIRAVALFPAVDDALKDAAASNALDPGGLYPRAIRSVKEACPDLLVISNAALDPYSSDGHDGLVIGGAVDNDATLPMLAQMAVLQADSGADLIAPSDMMDGRVGVIREALDAAGHTDVAILSYTAKYASSFYGPFREALDSAPRELENVPSDKKTYQMNPANVREALREAALDLEEGADILMVKPGMPYLDVVRAVRDSFPDFPLAVYNVSGEYAMIKAAAERGWLDEKPIVLEILTAFKRAGADMIFTYHAKDAARWLQST